MGFTDTGNLILKGILVFQTFFSSKSKQNPFKFHYFRNLFFLNFQASDWNLFFNHFYHHNCYYPWKRNKENLETTERKYFYNSGLKIQWRNRNNFFNQQIIVFKKDISSFENCKWRMVSELTKTLQKVTKCSACLWQSVQGNKLLFCLLLLSYLFQGIWGSVTFSYKMPLYTQLSLLKGTNKHSLVSIQNESWDGWTWNKSLSTMSRRMKLKLYPFYGENIFLV